MFLDPTGKKTMVNHKREQGIFLGLKQGREELVELRKSSWRDVQKR